LQRYSKGTPAPPSRPLDDDDDESEDDEVGRCMLNQVDP
jgi:hypothetical protein